MRKLEFWKRGCQRTREPLSMILAAAVCVNKSELTGKSQKQCASGYQSGSIKKMEEKRHAKILEVFSLQCTIKPLVISLRPLFIIKANSQEDKLEAREPADTISDNYNLLRVVVSTSVSLFKSCTSYILG